MSELQVKIKKRLGEFRLDVEFEMENGVMALLGASGCGKSITLKCIAGIETPDEGRIVLNGRVLFDSGKKINLPPQKRHIGYMFQEYALFPNMTTEKNIMAGMGKKPDSKKVREYMQRFHLEGLEQHYPAQLSGGQKQRVAMARMLAAEPEVLLLDEPFSALDSYLKWELEQQMKDTLQEIGKPTLLVTHNRDEAYRLCDTVGCICDGIMEDPEPAKEFFEHPGTRAAAVLSGCKNISGAEVLDKHHLWAADWGITLLVEGTEIPEGTKAVGIRAHTFFNPAEKKLPEQTINRFPIIDSRILEDMFEWNVSFQTSVDGGWLQWKTAKKEWQEKPEQIPEMLAVETKNILFLR